MTLRVANDYAAVIEGQRAGNIHIAYYGPASFSRALMTGVKTDAFVIDVNSDGTKGYYSVFYVRADSPFQKIEDLKARTWAWSIRTRPRATTCRFVWTSGDRTPAHIFGKVLITGSHENAVIAVADKTVDVCANWWNADDDSTLTRHAEQGHAEERRRLADEKDDFRIIRKSDLIINSPYAYLADLPDDLKAAIAKAFLDAAAKDKVDYDRLSDGKNRPWEPVTNADYDKTIELVKFVDELRKKKSYRAPLKTDGRSPMSARRR